MSYYLKNHLSHQASLPQQLVKLIKPQDSILDVGCGNGSLKKLFPRHKLSGVDILPDSISMALRAGYTQAKLVDLNQARLPFKANSFNIIVCRQVLEHLLYPLKAVLEMHRVLKSKGTLFVSVPTGENRKFYDDYTHIRPFTQHSLTVLLQDASFNQLKFVYQLKGIPGLGLIKQIFNFDLETQSSILTHNIPFLREQANIEVIARK